MVEIHAYTSDSVVWNERQVQLEFIDAMSKNHDILLSFRGEGPALRSLSIYDFFLNVAKIFNYDISKIKLLTFNALEYHDQISIQYSPPIHLLKNAEKYKINYNKKQELKHFGLFVGRSNAPRLDLGSYIDRQYKDKSIYTYHFNTSDEFYHDNVGFEDLIKKYSLKNLTTVANFLAKCPIRLPDQQAITFDNTSNLNPAQQLLNNDHRVFCQTYEKFFVEIVCESYFSGTTFFPTEKIFRPILMKTPFIVQGPQYFLNNLRKFGFQTFNHWWDEGYTEDPMEYQLVEIKKLLDTLAKLTTVELYDMYQDMSAILEHNYQLALTLTDQDYRRIYETNGE
jgi:hypothetical protein